MSFGRTVQSVVLAAICGMPSSVNAVMIEWVTVGDPGNVPYEHGFGGVDYAYRIGKFEVTKSQYAEFLNAVARDDPNGLFQPEMDVTNNDRGGIERIGDAGSRGFGVRPVRPEWHFRFRGNDLRRRPVTGKKSKS